MASCFEQLIGYRSILWRLDQWFPHYKVWIQKDHSWVFGLPLLFHHHDLLSTQHPDLVGRRDSLWFAMGSNCDDRTSLCLGGFASSFESLPHLIHKHGKCFQSG